MDFEMSDEQKALKNMIRDFLKKECPSEYMQEVEENERFPEEVWNKMVDLGLLGVPIAEEYGGSGGDISTMGIVVEELSRGFPDLAFSYVNIVCFGGKSISFFGTEEQKKYYLPLLCQGKLKFALSLTEPNGGTDILGALKTRAQLEGNHFVLNGQKMFSSGSHIADYLVVLARTNTNVAKRSQGLSILLVDRRSQGVGIKPIKKLGFNSIATNEVIFENVIVPRENVLGELDQGWSFLLNTLNNERINVAHQAVGLAQGAFDLALAYAKQRQAFGKVIGQFQAIQHYLATMATDIELARLLAQKAAWLQTKGKPCGVEATMAKMFASETAFKVSSLGMQILGGYGFAMEYDMQRYFRDSRLLTVAPITNEMALNFIGESLGLPRSF